MGDSIEYDVFVIYNNDDIKDVLQIAEALRKRAIKIWLDIWAVVPGSSWQNALETIISSCKSALVCVGPGGIGPWQNQEIRALLRRYVSENNSSNSITVSLITVLLPGAPKAPNIPTFLEEFRYVDLRNGITEDGIDELKWGIKKERSELSDEPSSFKIYGLPIGQVVDTVRGQSTLLLNPEGFNATHKIGLIELAERMKDLLEFLRNMVSVDSVNQRKREVYKGDKWELISSGYDSISRGPEAHYNRKHDKNDNKIEVGRPELYYQITQELLMYEHKLGEILQEALGLKADPEFNRIKSTNMWNSLVVNMLPWPEIDCTEVALREISETIGTLNACIRLLKASP